MFLKEKIDVREGNMQKKVNDEWQIKFDNK